MRSEVKIAASIHANSTSSLEAILKKFWSESMFAIPTVRAKMTTPPRRRNRNLCSLKKSVEKYLTFLRRSLIMMLLRIVAMMM